MSPKILIIAAALVFGFAVGLSASFTVTNLTAIEGMRPEE
jgi:hypothetical protein